MAENEVFTFVAQSTSFLKDQTVQLIDKIYKLCLVIEGWRPYLENIVTDCENIHASSNILCRWALDPPKWSVPVVEEDIIVPLYETLEFAIKVADEIYDEIDLVLNTDDAKIAGLNWSCGPDGENQSLRIRNQALALDILASVVTMTNKNARTESINNYNSRGLHFQNADASAFECATPELPRTVLGSLSRLSKGRHEFELGNFDFESNTLECFSIENWSCRLEGEVTDNDMSEEETIERRVARIKARVAELTNLSLRASKPPSMISVADTEDFSLDKSGILTPQESIGFESHSLEDETFESVPKPKRKQKVVKHWRKDSNKPTNVEQMGLLGCSEYKIAILGDCKAGVMQLTSIFNKVLLECRIDPTREGESTRIMNVDEELYRFDISEWIAEEAELMSTTAFRSLIVNTDAIMLMYDMTDTSSLECLRDIHAQLCILCEIGNLETPVFTVIRNDILPGPLHNLGVDEGRVFAESIRADYFELSTRDNVGINEIFYSAVRRVTLLEASCIED